MSIRHLDDGRFEIVQPMFLWWPAKQVILCMLLADVFLSTVFLLQATDVYALLLLSSIILTALFSIGYDRESLPAIYIHFVLCLLYIFLCFFAILMIFYNPQICGEETCNTAIQWMRYVKLPIKPIRAYCFTGATIIFHLLMAPVCLRMIKYTAASKALKRMMADEEFAKKLKRSVMPAPTSPYPLPV